MFNEIDIENRLQNLFAKHPELHQYEIQPIYGDALYEIADFINLCWNPDYKDEPRIDYSTEFLEFNGLLESVRPTCVGAFNNGNLKAFWGGIQIDIEHERQIHKGIICTMLSVHPEHRGCGLAQWLDLMQRKSIREQGYFLSFYWFDARHSKGGSSHSIFIGRKAPYDAVLIAPIFAKVLDLQAPACNKLRTHEKIVSWVSSKFFPFSNPSPTSSIRTCTKEDINEAKNLICDVNTDSLVYRKFSDDELLLRFTYSKGNVTAVSLAIFENDKMQGLVFGYTTPYANSKYLTLDSAIFRNDIGHGKKRALFSSLEHIAKNQYGCYAISIPRTVTTENLLFYGYIPISQQTLAVMAPDNNFIIDENTLKSAFIELR